MLTQLSTIKARLGIDEFDLYPDAILTNAINAVSVRFDKETNRTLSRTANITEEFEADDAEIIVPCYPIESVSKFETKTKESEGWIEQTGIEFLVRRNCVISVLSPISILNSSLGIGRVTYTGGYVMPGTTPGTGQTPLPADLEQAAVEQVAAWFQTRDALGLETIWPHAGTYEKFSQLPLLPSVQSVLQRYQRWLI